MEESNQNIHKRLIRTFVRMFYGNGAYFVVNFLLEQEFRIRLKYLSEMFAPCDDDIDFLKNDHIIEIRNDTLVSKTPKGSGRSSSTGRDRPGQDGCFIDYPKALNVIEYAVYDLIDKYKRPPVYSYGCEDRDCQNEKRYDPLEYKHVGHCPTCGRPLVYSPEIEFKTDVVEYLKPLVEMIEKAKEVKTFPVVKNVTIQEEAMLFANDSRLKKAGGALFPGAAQGGHRGIEVVLDETKPTEALTLNADSASSKKKTKIPWLTKSYRDIIDEHREQEKEPAIYDPGARPPPVSPVEYKKVKIELQ